MNLPTKHITEKKLLVVGPAWVGDMVMAQTLFITLKQQHPEMIIDVLAPEWSSALLARMPEVNKSISLPIAHKKLALLTRYRIAKSLRKEKYQQAILLPNSFKSALIPWWANIPKRTGWLGEYRYGLLNDLRYLNKEKLPLMIQRFIALGIDKSQALPEKYPRPCLQVQAENVEKTLIKFNLNSINCRDVACKVSNNAMDAKRFTVSSERNILALCPGAEFGPAKRWPLQHYAKVANEKLKQGWNVWIFGSANDQSVAESIQQLTEYQCVNLAGKTSLAEAIDLLSVAKAVVSNDSGLMHIAAALNKPLVVTYGSSSPKFTPPLNDQVKILNLNLACSPCFKRECPYGHMQCLEELPPEWVIEAIAELSRNRKDTTFKENYVC